MNDQNEKKSLLTIVIYVIKLLTCFFSEKKKTDLKATSSQEKPISLGVNYYEA